VEFVDVIAKRRAVREFREQPVEQADLEKLIYAAILAPSAMNMQPWAFAVLRGRERIEGYSKRVQQWLLASLSTTSYDPSMRHMLEDPTFAVFHHAPALILILAKSAAPQASEDCCLAAENLMLAARELDLGTCPIGLARPWLDLPATKTELGLPAEYHVVTPIIVGYAKRWPDSPGRHEPEILWIS